jgi:predicted transcriptional regulator
MTEDQNDNLRNLVADVAAAYFSNSHVATAEIGPVIEQIAKSLKALGEQLETAPLAKEEPDATRRLTPAQIRKSITPDALISFEDGRPYKTLRRHLAVKGQTPEQYREKWGLPKNYPMVTENYSAARSRMAKQLGLGNHRTAAASPAEPVPRGRRRRSAFETPKE